MPEKGRPPGPMAGHTPIRTLPPANRMTVGQAFAPRIELVVGRDGHSGGISLVAYLCDEDGRAHAEPLFCHRWRNSPQSIEECLQVAYNGIVAYVEKAGYVLP